MDGTELAAVEVQASSEEAALDALAMAMREAIARGEAVPEWPGRHNGGWSSPTGGDAEDRWETLRNQRDASDLRALGLSTMPDANGLRSAWRKVALRSHPDRGGDAEEFKAARSAYERLSRQVCP